MKLASLDTKLLPEATARSEIEARETPSRFFLGTVKVIDPLTDLPLYVTLFTRATSHLLSVGAVACARYNLKPITIYR